MLPGSRDLSINENPVLNSQWDLGFKKDFSLRRGLGSTLQCVNSWMGNSYYFKKCHDGLGLVLFFPLITSPHLLGCNQGTRKACWAKISTNHPTRNTQWKTENAGGRGVAEEHESCKESYLWEKHPLLYPSLKKKKREGGGSFLLSVQLSNSGTQNLKANWDQSEHQDRNVSDG